MYVLSSRKGTAPTSIVSPSPSPYPSLSADSSPTQSVTTSPTNSASVDLGAGGSSYLDEKGVYSVLYPNDYTLDTQDPKHIRIYKRAESQRPQGEISDGVLMVFESVDLQGKSLESLVDTRIKEATADGSSQVSQSKKAITIDTYPGFSYSLKGVGSSQNFILQKDGASPYAVILTYAVNDPDQKGYQKEVEAVVSSLKLLK